MKGLKIILWITALCCLPGFVLAALPWKAVKAFCDSAGILTPVGLPITVVMYRLLSAMFGVIGIFFVILARNPLKYGGMLLLAAYGLVGFGVFSLAAGIRYGLPVWTYSCDFIFAVGAGLLLLVFRKKAEQSNSA